MYSVQHAARLTGIPAETLRKWEQRYAVVQPARSEAGYRMYDDEALRRLSTMRALVEAGWSPRLAAEQVKAGEVPGIPEGTPDVPGSPADELLASLATDLDPVRLDRELARVFTATPFEDLVDDWLLPSLSRLGTAWQSGAVSVGGEHFVSAAVERRVAAVLEAATPPPNAPRVLAGLSRASRHELGLLSFAAVLRGTGIEVVYVGADLAADHWADAVRSAHVRAVVLAAPTAEDVPGLRDAAAAIAAADPAVTIHVGGAHQDDVGPPTRPLGHRVVPAARALAASLAAA